MTGNEDVPLEMDPDIKLMAEAFDKIGLMRAWIGGHRGWMRVRKDLSEREITSRLKQIENIETVIDVMTRLVDRLGEKGEKTTDEST